jgi:hypothetical protein
MWIQSISFAEALVSLLYISSTHMTYKSLMCCGLIKQIRLPPSFLHCFVPSSWPKAPRGYCWGNTHHVKPHLCLSMDWTLPEPSAAFGFHSTTGCGNPWLGPGHLHYLIPRVVLRIALTRDVLTLCLCWTKHRLQGLADWRRPSRRLFDRGWWNMENHGPPSGA